MSNVLPHGAPSRLAQARKGLVALAGLLTTVLTSNLLPADVVPVVSAVTALLTALGVYLTPNAAGEALVPEEFTDLVIEDVEDSEEDPELV
jgi:hypothetical protein